VLVEAEGWSPRLVPAVGRGEKLVVSLDPPRVLAGTIMGTDGVLAGARVAWFGRLGGLVVRREAATGADGGFRIEGIPSAAALWNATVEGAGRPAWLEVRAEGWAPALVELASDEPMEAERARVDVTLSRGVSIEGRVMEEGNGRPVAGARVVCWHGDLIPRPLGEATADSSGDFRIACLPETPVQSRRGPTSWNARQGFVGAAAAGLVPRAREVKLGPKPERLELKLPPAGSVCGRVVDGAGRPVEGVAVTWSAEGFDSWTFPELYPDIPLRAVRTNAEGR